MAERRVARGAVILMALVVLGVVSWLVLNSPVFSVRTIRVLGNISLTADDVVELAGVGEGDNLFRVSPPQVEEALLRSAWVARAEVQRQWPSTLTLRVIERRPVAVARTGGAPVLVAGDGTVLAPSGTDGHRYPWIPPTPKALTSGDAYPGASSPVRVAASLPTRLRPLVQRVRVHQGDLTLDLVGGGAILYGDAGSAEAKNAAILAVLDRAQEEGIEVDYVDVRIPSAPALKPAGSTPTP